MTKRKAADVLPQAKRMPVINKGKPVKAADALTQLQSSRLTNAVKDVERLVHKRERAIATVVRYTIKIQALARQARRYEKLAAPK